MSAVVAEQELFRACQVIFGDELHVSRDFLAYLQMSGVKSAYRKRAKETHPDRFATKGDLTQRFCTRKFQVVQKAYKHLRHYVDAREKGYSIPGAKPQTMRSPKPPCAKPAPRKTPPSSPFSQKKKPSPSGAAFRSGATNNSTSVPKAKAFDSKALFKGNLPERPMLFGHFLYYSGLVDWQTIVRALIWQRACRPRVGDIGVRFGWLAQKDILTILQSGKCTEAFGKKAIARGKLNRYQMQAILAYQQKNHRKIGEYFLKKRLFSRMQLQGLLRKCADHNRQHEKLRRRAS